MNVLKYNIKFSIGNIVGSDEIKFNSVISKMFLAKIIVGCNATLPDTVTVCMEGYFDEHKCEDLIIADKLGDGNFYVVRSENDCYKKINSYKTITSLEIYDYYTDTSFTNYLTYCTLVFYII